MQKKHLPTGGEKWWWFTRVKQNWLVVSNHLKNISQIGNLPQMGMKIKNIWKPPARKPSFHIPWNPELVNDGILMMAFCNSHITGYYHPPKESEETWFWSLIKRVIGSADLFRYGLSCFTTESICTVSGTLCVKSHYRPKPVWARKKNTVKYPSSWSPYNNWVILTTQNYQVSFFDCSYLMWRTCISVCVSFGFLEAFVQDLGKLLGGSSQLGFSGLINMVIVSPLRIGLFPFQMA